MFPAVLAGTGLLAWRGFRRRDAVSVLLSGCVVFPLAFFVWRSFYGRIGDSWPLLVWPLAFACTAINLKQWRQTAPDSRLTAISPAISSGLVIVAATFGYYLLSDANYLGKNDPIGKEAGFARVVEAADKERERIGATYFATTDYRIYSMLRWHLRDRVPVAQVNERNRYLGFGIDARLRADATGLYVGPKDDPIAKIWKNTTAKLEPVGETDLVWRGFRYDTYTLQKITSWQPVLSPPPGDALYVGAPH